MFILVQKSNINTQNNRKTRLLPPTVRCSLCFMKNDMHLGGVGMVLARAVYVDRIICNALHDSQFASVPDVDIIKLVRTCHSHIKPIPYAVKSAPYGVIFIHPFVRSEMKCCNCIYATINVKSMNYIYVKSIMLLHWARRTCSNKIL